MRTCTIFSFIWTLCTAVHSGHEGVQEDEYYYLFYMDPTSSCTNIENKEGVHEDVYCYLS